MPARRGKLSAAGGSRTPFKLLKEQLQVIDLVIEVRDARLPESSGHPAADKLFGSKPRIVVLAKQDLADQRLVSAWLQRFSTESQQAIALSLKQARGQKRLLDLALSLTANARQSRERRGLLPRPLRACVVGLPNVGKSSLINWLIGHRKTRVGDRPGITRGTQWVRVHPQVDLLDTPGVLPPVEFDRKTAVKLAVCNILPAERYDPVEIADEALALLASIGRDRLERYGLSLDGTGSTLENLARERSLVAPGGKPDERRAAVLLLNDLRSGCLGPYVLDALHKET